MRFTRHPNQGAEYQPQGHNSRRWQPEHTASRIPFPRQPLASRQSLGQEGRLDPARYPWVRNSSCSPARRLTRFATPQPVVGANRSLRPLQPNCGVAVERRQQTGRRLDALRSLENYWPDVCHYDTVSDGASSDGVALGPAVFPALLSPFPSPHSPRLPGAPSLGVVRLALTPNPSFRVKPTFPWAQCVLRWTG